MWVVAAVFAFSLLAASSTASAQVAMFTFRGGESDFDAACEGFARQQLGWLNGNGRPLPIPAAQRVVIGGVVVGFTSNPGGAPVANGRAYDLDLGTLRAAYINAFAAPGGTLFHCGHGHGHQHPPPGPFHKGGLLDLDGGTTYAGFLPPGTGVAGFPIYLAGGGGALPAPPGGVGSITAHLHTCWSSRDPDGGGAEISVTASLGAVLGAANVTGHMTQAQSRIDWTIAGGTAAQRAAAQLALTAAANAAGHADANAVSNWIYSIPFSTAADPANQYNSLQGVIDTAVGGAGIVTLGLTYALPEAPGVDPFGTAFRSACRLPGDFGDAPDSYRTLLEVDGPRYSDGSAQRLGPLWDTEPDGQPSALADGDDLSLRCGCSGPLDDEDGVVFGRRFVDVRWTITRPGSHIYRLRAWWDLNRNGIFDHPQELLLDHDRVLGPGSDVIRYALPIDPRKYYSRFRLTWIDGNVDGVLPGTDILPWSEFVGSDGRSHGEVEDYPPSLVDPELHVVGPVPNQIPLGEEGQLSTRVRNDAGPVQGAGVVFTVLQGRVRFLDGVVSVDGLRARVITDADGWARISMRAEATGTVLVRVTVTGTSLTGYSYFIIMPGQP